MSEHSLVPIAEKDAERAFRTITVAHAEAPVERWLFPDIEEYSLSFPGFVAAVADQAFAAGSAWQLEDFAAVSLWMPPGTVIDSERVGAALVGHVARAKHADLFATLAKMDSTRPKYPHWFLTWIGVLPSHQNTGLGGLLLKSTLANLDRSGLPAFLESPDPRNVPFFERHGFVVTGYVHEGACPPLTFMLRGTRQSVQ